MGSKLDLFPDFDPNNPRFALGSTLPANDDYFVFYDDTAYEMEPGDGGNGGWDGLVTRYCAGGQCF
jgi:hypothetical protein